MIFSFVSSRGFRCSAFSLRPLIHFEWIFTSCARKGLVIYPIWIYSCSGNILFVLKYLFIWLCRVSKYLHLERQCSGDTVSVRVMSKCFILGLHWRLKGLQCWGWEASELRSWQQWKFYYKSPLWYASLYGTVWNFPSGTNAKEPSCQCRRLRDMGLIPG